MALDHEGEHLSRWAAAQWTSAEIRCSAHTLLDWLYRAGMDSGERAGLPSDIMENLNVMEWTTAELRQANGMPRKASAYFASNQRAAVARSPAAGARHH
jgi:transposase